MKKAIKTKQRKAALKRLDVIVKISKKLDLTQAQAGEAFHIVLDSITEQLLSGGHVEFRDFGVFEIATRKARIGRNPNDPVRDIKIPERKVVKFKAGKHLCKLIASAKL